jgi:TPR repeat protein
MLGLLFFMLSTQNPDEAQTETDASLAVANAVDNEEANKCNEAVDAKNWKAAWYSCPAAAENGDADSANNIGYLYTSGLGVEENQIEAVRWFRKAAEMGSVYAQYNLGTLYQNGIGVAQNLDEARGWFEKAAAQGDEEAKKRLAELQVQSEPTVSVEDSASFLNSANEAASKLTGSDFQIARDIASRGYPNARVSHLVGPDIPRGARYRGFIIGLNPSEADGLAVKGMFLEALTLYLQAYENERDPDAAHNIGIIYARGLGVVQNNEKALKFLEFSQENRSWDADSSEIAKIR